VTWWTWILWRLVEWTGRPNGRAALIQADSRPNCVEEMADGAVLYRSLRDHGTPAADGLDRQTMSIRPNRERSRLRQRAMAFRL
jgi:hypothetical protein